MTLIIGLAISYLGFAVLIQLVLATWASRNWLGVPQQETPSKRFAVLFPAYREDRVIIQSVEKMLSQQYDYDKFTIYAIADQLLPETLASLRKMPIQLIEVQFKSSTKTKALRAAMDQIPTDQFDAVLIMDADNLAKNNLLKVFSSYLTKGYRAIQGQRKASNLDTPFAIWDGIAEAINHHIFCKGPYQMGLSARLMGSGMVFELELFRQLIHKIEAVGGFDKAFELELSFRNIRIAYAENAIVLDEKVRNSSVYSKQRSRWIAAQYLYLWRNVRPALTALFQSKKTDYLFKVSLLCLTPRVVLPLILGLGTLIMIFAYGIGSMFYLFVGLSLLHLLTLFLATPKYFFRASYRKAWRQMGAVIWNTLLAILKSRKANKHFLHTPHGELDNQ